CALIPLRIIWAADSDFFLVSSGGLAAGERTFAAAIPRRASSRNAAVPRTMYSPFWSIRSLTFTFGLAMACGPSRRLARDRAAGRPGEVVRGQALTGTTGRAGRRWSGQGAGWPAAAVSPLGLYFS